MYVLSDALTILDSRSQPSYRLVPDPPQSGPEGPESAQGDLIFLQGLLTHVSPNETPASGDRLGHPKCVEENAQILDSEREREREKERERDGRPLQIHPSCVIHAELHVYPTARDMLLWVSSGVFREFSRAPRAPDAHTVEPSSGWPVQPATISICAHVP